MRDFISRCVVGLNVGDDIDDFVGYWHDGESGVCISDYLGMSHAEYSLWVKNPDAINIIIENRKKQYEQAERILDESNG